MLLPDYESPRHFVPPLRSQWFTRWFGPSIVGPFLRWRFNVHELDFRGADRLRASLDQKKGIVLAPNHCRFADPFCIGALSASMDTYFHYAASLHLFQKSRWEAWNMRAHGAFSVFREGVDRESIRACMEILADGRRPLVLFPEGTFYRQNDWPGPLRDGVAFVARQAARKGDRAIVVHPVAIKYWFTENPVPSLEARTTALEKLLSWRPRPEAALVDRLDKLTEGFLGLKELEHLEAAGVGNVGKRMERLSDILLDRLEQRYRPRLGARDALDIMKRVQAVRPVMVRLLCDPATGEDEKSQLRGHLMDVAVAQQLFAHNPRYHHENPNMERLSEMVQRIEEDVLDRERPIARTGAVIQVGKGFDPPAKASDDRDFMAAVTAELQAMMATLNQEGPPAGWSRWRSGDTTKASP